MSDFPYFREHLESVSFTPIAQTAVTRSINGTRQAFSYGGGYWKLECNFKKTHFSFAKKIAGFLAGLQGRSGTFKAIFPEQLNSNRYAGSILVDGANQTGRDINVKGMTTSQTILDQGDFIKFTNNNKIYQVRENLVSDGSGLGILKLHMPLVGTLPIDSENVIYKNIEWTLALANDEITFDIDVYCRSDWSLEFEEVWN